jgi:hypothetical protein
MRRFVRCWKALLGTVVLVSSLAVLTIISGNRLSTPPPVFVQGHVGGVRGVAVSLPSRLACGFPGVAHLPSKPFQAFAGLLEQAQDLRHGGVRLLFCHAASL